MSRSARLLCAAIQWHATDKARKLVGDSVSGRISKVFLAPSSARRFRIITCDHKVDDGSKFCKQAALPIRSDNSSSFGGDGPPGKTRICPFPEISIRCAHRFRKIWHATSTPARIHAAASIICADGNIEPTTFDARSTPIEALPALMPSVRHSTNRDGRTTADTAMDIGWSAKRDG